MKKKQTKWLDNFGKAENANESNVSLSENFNGLAYDTSYRNYSPAWGGQFQQGGSIPGTVGFTYARTAGAAPSEGKYAKKTLPSAQDGIIADKIAGAELRKSREYQDKKYLESLPQLKQAPSHEEELLRTGLRYADIATDVMQMGNFVPFPQAQFVGKIGNAAGSLVDLTQAGLDFYSGDVGSGSVNLASAALPSIIKNPNVLGGYKRSAKYSFGNRSFYVPVDRLYGHMTEKQLLGNRALLGALGAETIYDALPQSSSPNVINSSDIELTYPKSQPLPAKTESVNPAFAKKLADYMNTQSREKTGEVYGRKSYYPIDGFQNGGEMKFYQEGLDWKPKSMQDGGSEKISTSDPRYPELYKNRQVGAYYDGAFTLPDLDEVVVTGKDERVKEGMSQGSSRFLMDALGVLGSPQTGLMEVITGKQQTPSQAWGFDTTNKPWYHPKSISNFAMDAVLDPMNLVGVGVVDDLTRGLARRFGRESIGNQIQFDPIMLKQIADRSTSDLINKLKNRTQSSPTLRGYEDDIVDRTIYNAANESNQLPPPPSEIYIPGNISGAINQQSFRNRADQLYRESVKNILGYRDIDVSRVNNMYDADAAIDNWLSANRFDTPDFRAENFRNILDRYNVPADQTDIPDIVRSIDPSQKPQFLRDILSELPRSMSEDDLFNARLNYNNLETARNARNAGASASKPVTRNKSGFTKDEAIQASKDKDKISKMTEEEFQNTVMKPSGEIVEYVQGTNIDNLTYDVNTGRTVLKDQQILEPREYANIFNQNIDRLNEIIASKNRSGVQYRVKELNPSGYLKFETPEQTILDPSGMSTTIPSGESTWSVRLNPGQWKGEVQDLANSDYYRSIPGLEMSNTTGTVFSDRNPRRGTGAYEAINDYLKELNLGRVKPGFNSQTQFSKGAWENFIKSGRGVGYYANPNLVYGTMKTALPIGFGASYLSNQNREFKKGGIVKDNQGYWNPDNWGKMVEIDSNEITMKPNPYTGVEVPYDVLAFSNEGDVQYMEPGKDYKFKGSKVTEIPMAKLGINQLDAQPMKKLNQLLNFTNNPDKTNWLDKYQ